MGRTRQLERKGESKHVVFYFCECKSNGKGLLQFSWLREHTLFKVASLRQKKTHSQNTNRSSLSDLRKRARVSPKRHTRAREDAVLLIELSVKTSTFAIGHRHKHTFSHTRTHKHTGLAQFCTIPSRTKSAVATDSFEPVTRCPRQNSPELYHEHGTMKINEYRERVHMTYKIHSTRSYVNGKNNSLKILCRIIKSDHSIPG